MSSLILGGFNFQWSFVRIIVSAWIIHCVEFVRTEAIILLFSDFFLVFIFLCSQPCHPPPIPALTLIVLFLHSL